jgi:hypothetical protein
MSHLDFANSCGKWWSGMPADGGLSRRRPRLRGRWTIGLDHRLVHDHGVPNEVAPTSTGSGCVAAHRDEDGGLSCSTFRPECPRRGQDGAHRRWRVRASTRTTDRRLPLAIAAHHCPGAPSKTFQVCSSFRGDLGSGRCTVTHQLSGTGSCSRESPYKAVVPSMLVTRRLPRRRPGGTNLRCPRALGHVHTRDGGRPLTDGHR